MVTRVVINPSKSWKFLTGPGWTYDFWVQRLTLYHLCHPAGYIKKCYLLLLKLELLSIIAIKYTIHCSYASEISLFCRTLHHRFSPLFLVSFRPSLCLSASVSFFCIPDVNTLLRCISRFVSAFAFISHPFYNLLSLSGWIIFYKPQQVVIFYYEMYAHWILIMKNVSMRKHRFLCQSTLQIVDFYFQKP